MIFERLKEERKRLGHSQESFAALAGITRRPYAEWESGNTSPTAVQLAAMAGAGLDVMYVVTGMRANAEISDPSEQVLIASYRACDAQARRQILASATLMAAGINADALEKKSPVKMKNSASDVVQIGVQHLNQNQGALSGGVNAGNRGKAASVTGKIPEGAAKK